MSRLRPLAVLGFALALPLPASALDSNEPSEPAVIAVANTEAAPAPRAEGGDVAAPVRREPEAKRSEASGRHSWDPVASFRSPYSFPLQAVPVAVPAVTGFSF